MSAFVEQEQDLTKPTTEEARIDRHNGQIARAEGNVALNDATPDTPFIASNAMAAAIYEQDEQKKRKERDSIVKTVSKLRELAAKLEALRDYHQAQADYYQEQADAGFALYEEMEDFKDDLLADYNDDGVLSDEARQRALDLIRRAGKDTDNLTDDMIVQLYLQAQQETLNTSVFNQARADENRDKADEYEQERLAIQSMAYDGALQAEATGNRDEYVAQATGMILQVESLYAEQVTLESEADFLENGLFTEAHIISDESPAEQPVTQSTLEVGLF